jgi:iron complex transport system permease protein
MKNICRFSTVAALLALLVILLAVAGVKCGTLDIPWKTLVNIFSDSSDALIVRELRLARVLAALISGASSAFAGTILQKILRNDLASPDILGISSGAGAAGVALILLFPALSSFLTAGAFLGALSAAALICLAAWHKKLSPMRLILAGVAISALFSSLTGVLFIFHPDKLFPVMEFTIGGFSGRTMQDICHALPAAALLAICGVFLPRRLDLLSIGDSMALSLGANVGKNRLFALSVAALAGALTTSLAGLAGFTGLMAPHIAGKLTGEYSAKALLITAPLTGAALMLTGDIAGRVLFAPYEIPAGLPLSFAGAIFFLVLLTGKSGDTE